MEGLSSTRLPCQVSFEILFSLFQGSYLVKSSDVLSLALNMLHTLTKVFNPFQTNQYCKWPIHELCRFLTKHGNVKSFETEKDTVSELELDLENDLMVRQSDTETFKQP